MIDMTPYSCMSREELEREYGSVLASYEACKAQGLNLNMARGKPATEQLDMVSGLLTVLQTPRIAMTTAWTPGITASWRVSPAPGDIGRMCWAARRIRCSSAARLP